MTRVLKSRTFTAVIAATVVAVAVGGVAAANHDADTIHACIGPDGSPRIVDEERSCRSTETYLE